jgi:thiamine biosynthesis lipoprotein
MHRISTDTRRARPLLGTFGAAPLLQQLGQSSLAVRAPSSMVADALTKIVMIAGAEAAASPDHHRASAIFVSADGDVHASTNWQGVRHHAS